MIKKIFVSILMLLVLVSSAMAVDVTVGGTSGEVTISNDVIRSNPELEGDRDELDDDNEIEYAEFLIDVTVANGSINVTGATANIASFTYDTFAGEVSTLARAESTSTFPITITNSTQNVEFRVIVPSNLDSITNDFDQAVYSVPITLQTTDGDKTVIGKFSVENGLTMSDVDLIQGDETYQCDVDTDYDQNLDCDSEIDELEPGMDFYIEFEVNNEFSSGDDLDIEDINFEIFSDDRDVESDDDSFDEDLNSGDSFDVTMDFTVDTDVEDGEIIEITIIADGNDVNGARHGFKYVFDIEFLIPKYDVRVNSLTLSPSAICQGEETSIAYEIENFGSRSQDDVQILIENADLDVERVFTRIELEAEDDRDNDYKDVYSFQTAPNVDAGQYDIEFTVAYDDDGDVELIELVERLTIRDCEGDDTPTQTTDTTTTTDTNESPNVIYVQPSAPQTQPTTPTTDNTASAAPVTVTAQKSSNVGLTVGLVFAILVLLIVIGVIVVAIMRKD